MELKEWIKAHPYIKFTAICVDLKLDKSNMMKKLNSNVPFKKSEIDLITHVLKDYGFNDIEPNEGFIGIIPSIKKYGGGVNFDDELKKDIPSRILGIFNKANENIPPMPVKEKGEDSFDFAERKNEWKRKYGQP